MLSRSPKNTGPDQDFQKPAVPPSTFDAMADSALIREYQLVQSSRRPNATAPLPFSAQTLGRMVTANTFPAPVRLSKRVVAWKVGSVRAWLKQQEVQA